MRSRGWMTVGAVALVLAALAAWWWQSAGEQVASQDAHAAAQGDEAGPATMAEAILTPDHVRARLFEQGAKAIGEPPGSWCVQPETGLTVCPDLRRRFDFYSVALGGAPDAEVRAAIAEQAARDHGDKTAQDILALWDRYQRLRTHTWQRAFDPADAATWRPAYEERHEARRQILGPDWAERFYGLEEARFLAHLERFEAGKPPPPGDVPPL